MPTAKTALCHTGKPVSADKNACHPPKLDRQR
jgi:hypothetical protein